MSKTKNYYYNFDKNFQLFKEKAKNNNDFFKDFVQKLKKEKIDFSASDNQKKTIIFKNKERWMILKVVFSGEEENFKKFRLQMPPKNKNSSFDRLIGFHEETKVYFLFEGKIQTESETISSVWIELLYFLYFKENGQFKFECKTQKRNAMVYVNKDILKLIQNINLGKKNFFPIDKNKEKEYPLIDKNKEKEYGRKLEKEINIFNTKKKQELIKKQQLKNKKPNKETEKDLTGYDKEYPSKTRIGNQKLRQRLIKKWKECPITKIKETELLWTSHIKPWRDSNEKEKVNCKNAILLSSIFNDLLDKGLMSFKNNGKIIFSPKLSDYTKTHVKKQIKNSEYFLKIRENTDKNYLEFHRKNIFKNKQKKNKI